MSQHDMNIANQGFPAFRADLNAALGALVSSNSGATAPATTFANMPWYDTANNIFKIRNEDNDAWISIFTLNQSTDVITAIGSVTLADVVSLTGTQTLTNKTLTSPAINGQTVDKITDTQGAVFTPSSAVMRNRIINGAMVIDQRNAGASVTPASGSYTLDRWQTVASQASKFSVQQNAGSVTPPTGFTNYLGITSLSAYTVGSSELFNFLHNIEGFNVADLGWGTANAKTVTLSFQVYSSLTGTFGGAFNNGGSRSYPFTYSIPTANTWTSISITVAGDTSGTWGKTNGSGIQIWFSLGCGSSQSGTAGAWTGSNFVSATGATSVVGTNGATFYITGVQLEVGTQATSFEYRQYGTELALCQRYYYKIFPAESSKGYGNGTSVNTTNIYNTVPSPVTMRVNPTLETTGTASDYAIVRGGGTNTACSSVPTITDMSHRFMLQVNGFLSSGLVDGYSGWLRTNSASSYLGFNAEL